MNSANQASSVWDVLTYQIASQSNDGWFSFAQTASLMDPPKVTEKLYALIPFPLKSIAMNALSADASITSLLWSKEVWSSIGCWKFLNPKYIPSSLAKYKTSVSTSGIA